MYSEREQLRCLIQQWNENRLDLFNLSMPDENDEFFGVMRFYFQEPGEKVATKCVRVASTATTPIVLEALVEKFKPELTPVSNHLHQFAIYEVHENGEERRLAMHEHPLIVQLTWHKDDREGRFLLRRNEISLAPSASSTSTVNTSVTEDISRAPKRFSKREKKELKKKYQRQLEEEEMRRKRLEEEGNKKLYDEVPPTTFTRTISNPEAVMKKRREQRLENKLKEMGHGGSLKVYGGDLNPNKPYVTLLVGINDRAYKVVRDTLDKYGFEKVSADEFMLVQITLAGANTGGSGPASRSLTDLRDLADSTTTEELILHDDERPLMALLDNSSGVERFFAVKRRPEALIRSNNNAAAAAVAHASLHHADTASLSSAGTGSMLYQQIGGHPAVEFASEPALVPLDQNGREILEHAIHLRPGPTEIGSEPGGICIRDPTVRPRHCLLNFCDGSVIVTPLDGLCEVNGLTTELTSLLRDGFVLRIAGRHAFRFRAFLPRNPPVAQSLNSSSFGAAVASSPAPSQTTFDPWPESESARSLPSPQAQATPTVSRPSSRMGFATVDETTFGVVDGQVLRRARSVDAELDVSTTMTSVPIRPFTLIPTSKSTTTTNWTINNTVPHQPLRMGPAPAPLQHSYGDSDIRNLPALIELNNQTAEDEFLRLLILESSPEDFPLRLTPAFVLYMVTRYRVSAHLYCPGISTDERRRALQVFLEKAVERIFHVVHVNNSSRPLLAFWLTNTSELLNLLVEDREVAALAGPPVLSRLRTTVEKAYDLLVEISRVGLQSAMTSFLHVDLADNAAAREVLTQLDDLVRLIRHCRLNAAITIQLFSQLFYFINMYAFNWLVTTREGGFYLSRQFGHRLKERLNLVTRWSESHGLELAAECHLDRIHQTVNLLTTPKSIDQIASLGATCYKLNSLQVRYLLQHYVPEVGETRASAELIDEVSRLAQQQADAMAVQDGLRVQLEESPQLQLPFVFPTDGFIVESFHGLPAEMSDFIASLQAKGICRMLPQIGATGSWTVHMNTPLGSSMAAPVVPMQSVGTVSTASGSLQRRNEINGNGIAGGSTISSSGGSHVSANGNGTARPTPTTMVVQLRRVPGESIGLSIVAAQGIGDNHCGIYVKKVVDNSTAKRDGRLELGDQLLSVNGNSLIGITQEQAAGKISSAGADVRFEVSKRAAFYNGIVDSLEKHSPNGAPPMHHNNNNIIPPGYKHARSASASELFAAASQNSTTTDSGSMTSGGHPVGNGRLPSHYKTANRAPVVIQPQRPGAVSPSPLRKAAASPTPLYSQMERRNASGNYYAQPVTSSQQYQRSASTVPFSATAPKQQWLDNYANLPSIPPNGASPHFRQTSTGSSPLPAPPRPQESHIQPLHTSYFPPAPVRPLPTSTNPTGRLSAPLFDHPTRNYVQHAPHAPPPRALTSDELDAELDAIESKAEAMTEADIARYHDLLGRIAELRGGPSSNGVHEAPRSMSKPNYTLPFMNEMASKLEAKKQRADVTGTTFGASHRGSAERLIDDVTQQLERINTSTDDEEVFHGRHHFTNEASTSSATTSATPSRPAMRDNSVSPEDKSKKRVQFSDDVKENGDEQTESEPRVQIVGKHEVYNDPRQRRLNEIQAKSIKPVVDGANMAFRDKMKMFATQLGEGVVRDRQKSSSAQREIELGVSNEAS